MYPYKFVATCQQLLVIGAVFAALVPAANVVTLDVVREHGAGSSDAGAAAEKAEIAAALSAYQSVAHLPTAVPSAPVDAVVRDVELTSVTGGVQARTASAAQAKTTTTILSAPQSVVGFGTVGVTWEHGETIDESDIDIEVRTQTDGVWGDWVPMEYHDEHAPDAGTAEASTARPGTDEALVGHVDSVQVRATVPANEVPDDLTMSVISPGKAAATTDEAPAIDTSELAAPRTEATPDTTPTAEPTPADEGATTEPAPSAATDPAITLSAGTVAQPMIYSRAQWGADEKIREQSAPSYGTIHGGFVHHTVNANDYTAAEVPGIIRSIYAYHVKSKGWRDIGYNFLVDRFGRIWEGRYGGVDRPVIGAHTENYNNDSFAMSAIGNYDVAEPSQEIVGAFGALFAWKLSLHGVSAAATSAVIAGKTFPSTIMGHRDTKSTACPGKFLYARIPDIRRAAASLQAGWAFAPRQANLVGTAYPDIIARRSADGRGVIIPTNGASGFAGRIASGAASGTSYALSPDLTGDGRADVVAWNAAGALAIRPGTAKGTFGAATAKSTKARNKNLVIPVGDINSDGRNDLAVRSTKNDRLGLLLGGGNGKFKPLALAMGSFKTMNWISAGDINGDGKVDLVARDTTGALWTWLGAGNATFGKRFSLGNGWGSVASMALADFNGDGKADLIYQARKTKVGYVRLGTGAGFLGNLGPYKGLSEEGRLLGATQVVRGSSPEVLATRAGKLDLLVKKDTTDLGVPVVTNLDLRDANLVLNVGDWNNDGKGDVAYRTNAGVLNLVRGDGNGGFSGPIAWGNFGGYSLIAAVGDMTGDGFADLMAQDGNGMRIFPGDGGNGLRASYPMYGRIAGSSQIAAGPWDADKAPDVLIRDGDTLQVFRGNGPGGLSAPRQVATGMNAYDWVLGLGSLALGTHSDLVVRQGGTLYSVSGKTNGTLGKRHVLGYDFGGYDLAG